MEVAYYPIFHSEKKLSFLLQWEDIHAVQQQDHALLQVGELQMVGALEPEAVQGPTIHQMKAMKETFI